MTLTGSGNFSVVLAASVLKVIICVTIHRSFGTVPSQARVNPRRTHVDRNAQHFAPMISSGFPRLSVAYYSQLAVTKRGNFNLLLLVL